MSWRVGIVGLALFGVGCGGELKYGQADDAPADQSADAQPRVDMSNSMPDMTSSPPPDQAQELDMASPTPDQGGGDPCAQLTCGANSTCQRDRCVCDAGFTGNPKVGCTPADPCAAVTCPRGGICEQGTCACGPGFEGDGSSCSPISPGDTALRTEQEVCTRWNDERAPRATTQWQVEPLDDCDWGVLHPEVVSDAQRRLNLYRWLVGLGPVGISENAQKITQACSTTLAATNTGLSHSIDTSYTCYTPEAKQGAGSSNLASGVSRPADSVDLYIGDRGVPSLGHRRWVFNPPMGLTGFGQRGRYSCMYSFDRSVNTSVDYVAYPAPGFFPQAAVLGQWSFSSGKYRFDASTTVTIKKVSDGATIPVTGVNSPGGGYGQPTLAWTVKSTDAPVGEELEVTIDNLKGTAGTTVTYRVTLAACR